MHFPAILDLGFRTDNTTFGLPSTCSTASDRLLPSVWATWIRTLSEARSCANTGAAARQRRPDKRKLRNVISSHWSCRQVSSVGSSIAMKPVTGKPPCLIRPAEYQPEHGSSCPGHWASASGISGHDSDRHIVAIDSLLLLLAILRFATVTGREYCARPIAAVLVGALIADRGPNEAARYGRCIIASAAAKLVPDHAANQLRPVSVRTPSFRGRRSTV